MIGKKVHIINKTEHFDELAAMFWTHKKEYIGIVKDKIDDCYVLENIETKTTHKVSSFTDIKILDDNVDLRLYALRNNGKKYIKIQEEINRYKRERENFWWYKLWRKVEKYVKRKR